MEITYVIQKSRRSSISKAANLLNQTVEQVREDLVLGLSHKECQFRIDSWNK